ncbi:MAG: 1-(5-phosphoribosyl)-5-[(5-phosphoribosylamino)methylideneamino]imidazole-4-carboxamide isomerase [Candidatus Omnitrophota bacterium]
MLIIPAIDIKDGKVIRLLQGDYKKKTVYSHDPVKTARHWVRQGARLIHVVDLDGAACGEPKNLALVEDIVRQTEVPVEFGGGVRSLEAVKELLDSGIARVVLGTRAAEDIAFLKQAFGKFKDKVIVSIDAKDGKVMVSGWQESCRNKKVLDFARVIRDIGFRRVIYTDTAKDGALKGPNIKDTKSLLKETGLEVIASGGVSSLEDVCKLAALKEFGLAGIIIGKALYEGKFTLSEAIKIF